MTETNTTNGTTTVYTVHFARSSRTTQVEVALTEERACEILDGHSQWDYATDVELAANDRSEERAAKMAVDRGANADRVIALSVWHSDETGMMAWIEKHTV